MKRQIRQGVFETNSSSVHSLTICDADEYQKWQDGTLVMDDYNDKLVEVTDETKEDEDRYRTFESYWKYKEDNFECFENEHTTKSGDKIMVFGYHGHDG